MGTCEGPVQEGFLAGDQHLFAGNDGEKRDNEAGQKTGLSAVQLVQLDTARSRPDSGDNNCVTLCFYLSSQGLCYGQGALVVSAGGIAPQVRCPFGQGGGHNGALRKALGRGHGKGRCLHKAETVVHGFPHGRLRPLAGGGGVLLAKAGIGKGCAEAQGVQARCASGLAHAEGHQRPGGCVFVQSPNDSIIGLGGGCSDYFYHFSTKTPGPFHQGLEYFQGRRAGEIVVRTDEHGTVFPAGLAEAASHGGGRLHLQIGIFGAGPDGHLQQFRSL